jgi:hypothetical protein
MSTYREFTFGTTVCRICVNKHVEPLATDHPSVARAVCNDEEITEQNGQPVERSASTDNGAIQQMCRYLEERFRPQAP